MSVATQIANLQAAYESNCAAIAGYADELAALSVAPVAESYDLDGEGSRPNELRANLLALIEGLSEANEGIVRAINALSPWAIRTRQVLR